MIAVVFFTYVGIGAVIGGFIYERYAPEYLYFTVIWPFIPFILLGRYIARRLS